MLQFLLNLKKDLQFITYEVHKTSCWKKQLQVFLFYDAFWILLFFRLKQKTIQYKILGFHTILRIFMLIRYHIEFDKDVQIGEGTQFVHQGVVIGTGVRIGRNCKFYGFNTIGFAKGQIGVVIGDNVEVGTGAKILGGPITIGNNVTIGANAVVLTSIPDNCMAVGVPARIIKKKLTKENL